MGPRSLERESSVNVGLSHLPRAIFTYTLQLNNQPYEFVERRQSRSAFTWKLQLTIWLS